jgi:hypothetical protein
MEDGTRQTASREFDADTNEISTWKIPTGKNVKTRWVELEGMR